MQLTPIKKDNHLLLNFAEQRLDASNAPSFKSTMEDFISNGEQRIVLDMSQLKFMDSSGLGAVVSAYKRLGNSGSLVLCGINGVVAELFKLTRMNEIFTITDTAAEAGECFQQAAL